MNFKEAYGRWNETIMPDQELTKQLLNKAQKKKPPKKHFSWYGTAAAAFLFCAVLLCSIPVLAVHVDPVYQFLYLLSPETAQYLMPVQMASEDQGIRMEVVSAYIHEDTARIYITMEDLEGNRIDETTDLFDSYSIHRPFASIGTCERAGYDTESGKVSFLITLEECSGEWKEHPIEGDKITFSVQEFISRKSAFEDLMIPLDLAELPVDPATRETDLSGCGGDFEAYGIEDTAAVLLPNTSMDILSDGSIILTAIGYRDGMLHIQTSFGDTREHDNHGYLWLENDEGTRNSTYSIHFRDETDEEHPMDYTEEVFDISMEELSDCTLHGYYVISGQKTEGSWRVTFPLEQF